MDKHTRKRCIHIQLLTMTVQLADMELILICQMKIKKENKIKILIKTSVVQYLIIKSENTVQNIPTAYSKTKRKKKEFDVLIETMLNCQIVKRLQARCSKLKVQ